MCSAGKRVSAGQSQIRLLRQLADTADNGGDLQMPQPGENEGLNKIDGSCYTERKRSSMKTISFPSSAWTGRRKEVPVGIR